MAGWRSLYPNVVIPEDIIVTDFVFENAHEHLDSVALVDGYTGVQYTYKELLDNIRRLSQGLVRDGFGKGDVLCLYAPNCPEYAMAFFGVMGIGGTITTVNPQYTKYELAKQLEDSSARYILTIPQLVNHAKEAARDCGGIRKVYVLGKAEGCTPFRDLLKSHGEAAVPRVPINTREDTAAILYSSGTTGLPKGVMQTHYNIVANMRQVQLITREWEEVASQIDREIQEYCYLLVLPMFHTFGIHIVCHQLFRGQKIVLLPRFEPELFLETIQKYRVTCTFLVPPLVVFLAKHPMVANYDLSSLKDAFCGAAPLGEELQNETKDRLQLDALLQGYGLTETSPVATSQPAHGYKMGSSGILLPNTEARVIDTINGNDLGPNEDGEIWLRGPQVMKGYLNRKDATDNCIDKDGWFHTGDIGHFDDDQHIYVVDRLKELIKCKGFQVAPAELEALLLSHPDVADAGVIGVPDERDGEHPRAYIVIKDGITTPKQNLFHKLTDYVKEHAAPYKQLSGGVEFVGEIPKSPAGKILRRVLTDMAKASYKKSKL